MPQTLTPALFADSLHPGVRIHWPGCVGHSPLFEAWLRDVPERCAGVWFCGVWIPGVNRFDPTALHPEASASSFFISRDLQPGWRRGAVQHLPLHYSEAEHWLAQHGRFDLVLLHLAPPDEEGRCSLSVASDFAPAVLAALGQGARVFAHLNPLLPRTRGPWVAASKIHAWVEAALPPLTLAPEPPPAPGSALADLARAAATLVHDGDTVQLGLGRLQAAVLAQLHRHRGLRLHAGMVSEGLLALADAGALAEPQKSAARGDGSGPGSSAGTSPERGLWQPAVCAGVALGSTSLYQRVADPSDPAAVQFAPVSHTHGAATLAALPNLVAINSALQMDLLGQVNCEWINGRLSSGVGGLVDFLRGARASRGGRAVVALTAQVAGNLSRIVPLLAPGSVSVARGDIDYVVTEHGVASLRGLDVDARAQALIGIAAPVHREALAQAWHTLRRQF